MYRIFCESYQNFVHTIDDESYRKKITEPFELIVNINKYKEEKNKQSKVYKKLSDLLCYMEKHVNEFPRVKAFLWTLESRNMIARQYNVSNYQELEEQTKLINSFLKLAYWY